MTCVIATCPCFLPGFLPQCLVLAVGGQVEETRQASRVQSLRTLAEHVHTTTSVGWSGEGQDMSDEQNMVIAFHRAFDIIIGTSPAIPDEATCALRMSLIQEEFDELREALAQQDIEAVAKELADLLYVVYGTAVSCGIDMALIFREVHRSNMSKVGGRKRADGKWMKPPNYSPARLQPILTTQGTLGEQSVATHEQT
jgi:predicted HAD superfamily Cof-like phosphohydrolase